MTSDFDPYHKWLGISPAEQPPSHYRLLGISEFESDPQVIEAAADRQLTFLRKQQLGQHQHAANDLLNEVTRARRVLLKPDSKSEYDATLTSTTAKGTQQTAIGRLASLPPVAIWAGSGVVVLVVLAGIISFALPARTPVAPPTDAAASLPAEPVKPTIANAEPTTVEKPKPSQPPQGPVVAHLDPKPLSIPKPEKSKPVRLPPTRPMPATPSPSETEPKPPARVPTRTPSTPSPVKPTEVPAVAVTKAAVPEQATQNEAKKTIKSDLKDEYAQAKKPAAKVELATVLIAKSKEQRAADAQMFVMLTEALDLAADGGDSAIAQQAIGELENRFSVRPFELKLRLLSATVSTAKSPDEATLLLTKYSDLAEESAKAQDYATAIKAMTAAISSLIKPAFRLQKEYARQEAKRYTAYQEAYLVAKTAEEKLATEPTDPEASLTWGRFLCCYQESWETGLPLLAQSDDKVWKSLAERELNKPTESAALLQLGDDWLKAGDKEKDPIHFQTRERANLAWEAALESASDEEEPKLAKQVDQRTAKLFDKSLASAKGDITGVPLIGTEPLDPGSEFTIEFWVATTSVEGMLVTKQFSSTDSSVQLRLSLRRAGEDPRFHLETVSGDGGGGSETSNTISDGHWHHVALVVTDSSMNLFIDGRSVAKQPLRSGNGLQSASPWRLGSGRRSPYLSGQFGRVRISNVVRYTETFSPQKQFRRDLSTLYLR
ncbi:MAG: hypothetical protein JWN70_1948 [Planctomycetaceae bacterium]|nr:hypothetical protein [Planctomycetaceae bacterium]